MKNIITLAAFAATLAISAGAANPVRITPTAAPYQRTEARYNAPKHVDEEETWVSLGVGQFRDNLVCAFYSIDSFPQMDVEIQESSTTPGRYRVVNPYHNYPYTFGFGETVGDVYMIVDASDPEHCFVEQCPTRLLLGYNQTGDLQQLAVWSIADDYYNNLYGNWEKAEAENVCGKIKNGCITFPPMSLLSTIVHAEKEINWDMQWIPSNPQGKFRVRLPGAPKLDVEVKLEGLLEGDVAYYMELEDDLDYVKVALVEGESSPSIIAGVIDNSIDWTEVSATGQITFPYTKDGVFTLVAVPYYKGEAQDAVVLTKEYAYSEDEWRKCGLVHYTEAILSSNEMTETGYMQIDPDDYDVELEENVKTPGLFRLVDPYGPPYIYSGDGGYDSSHKYYMEIDATDTEAVFIKRMEPIGLSFAWGRNAIESRAYRMMTKQGMSKEDVLAWEREKGYRLFGTHKDNKITMPEESIYWIVLDQPTQPTYWANSNGKFCVEMKEGQVIGGTNGVEGVATDFEDAAAEWFTISGLRLPSVPTEPGIYVMRKGKEVTKVALK